VFHDAAPKSSTIPASLSQRRCRLRRGQGDHGQRPGWRGALNARASFILGSASILIGAVTGILGAATNFHPVQRNIVHWGIAVGILIYLVVVYFAWRAYRQDKFKVIEPFRLTDYLRFEEYETKRYMIRTRLDNYLIDRDTLARKTGFTALALIALFAEVVWLAILLIVVAVASG